MDIDLLHDALLHVFVLEVKSMLLLLLLLLLLQVREAISILDLDVTVYPTPKDGKVWRPKAVELGGKAQ
jgi:hypothetical protein